MKKNNIDSLLLQVVDSSKMSGWNDSLTHVLSKTIADNPILSADELEMISAGIKPHTHDDEND